MGAHVKSRSHSMLKIGPKGVTVDHGIPRQPHPLRMYFLSLGLFFLFASVIPGARACSPCASPCECVSVDEGDTKCAVDCSNNGLKSISRYDLPDSSKWTVIKLNLSRNRIAPDANFFDNLVHLETLDISYNGITSLDSTTFTKLTDLKELNLSGNEIQVFNDKSFEIPTLETLDLSGNPVSSFGKYTFTSSSSITALYINNLKLKSLPEYMFRNLKKLKVLCAQGNEINYIDKDAFSKNNDLTLLDISHNFLKSIDEDTFEDLTALSYLDLSHNDLMHIDTALFKDLSSALTSLNIAFNPWKCDCELKPFRDYLVKFLSLNRLLLNQQNVSCSSSPEKSFLDPGEDKFWWLYVRSTAKVIYGREKLRKKEKPSFFNCLSISKRDVDDDSSDEDDGIPSGINCQVSNSKKWCTGADSYFSCYDDEEENTQTTVAYSQKFTKSTELECAETCFQQNLAYGMLSSTTCLCGNVSSTIDCSCTGNSYTDNQIVSCSGSSSSLTFMSNVFKVYTGLTFNPISKITAGTSQNFVAKVNFTNINQYEWKFGDSSYSFLKGATSTSYSINYTYPVPGKFTLTVKVCVSSASVCEEGSVNVIVHPPSSLIKPTLTGDTYIQTTAKATVSAAIPVGQGVEISWTRSPSDSYTATTGAECSTSWDMFRGRCLLKGSTTKTYDDATTACSTNSLVTHLHSNQEVSDLATLYSSVNDIYLEAKKNGNFYKWKDNSYSYFSTSDVTGSSDGDCVVIETATSSLKGVDCTTVHGYACQSVPSDKCPYGGSFLASSSYCYVQKSSSLSWTDASTDCQSITTNARLAVVNSATLQSHLTSNVVTTRSWIGLSDRQLEGLPVWVNGEMLGDFNPLSWVPDVDCFTLDSSGSWAGYSCKTMLPYVCEYSVVKELVDVRTFIAGTAALNPTDNNYNLETLTSTTFTTPSDVIATVFPGHWFSYSGTILSWNFRVAALTNTQKLTFQVFRLECTSGLTLLTPECSGNGARFSSCKSTSATCTQSSTCDEGKQWCYLDNTCKPVSDPCNCNNVAASKCGTFYEGSQPKYVAVGQTSVVLPASADQRYYTVEAGDIDVQENDIIGFSTDSGTNVILCDTGVGNWMQNGHQSSLNDWIPINNAFSPDDWKNNTACYLQAVYAPSETKNIPDHLSYFVEPGAYEFQLSVTSPAETKTHTLEVEEEIGIITWIYPALQASGMLYMEQGLPELMVLRISAGSNAQVNWTVVPTTSNAPTTYTTDLETSCPSGNYIGLHDSCNVYLNWPAKPFANTKHAFSINKEGTLPTLDLKVFNQISSQTKSISVKLFIPIGGVTLALKTPNSNNYVEYNANSVFETSLFSGSPTLYTYYINDTEVSSTFSPELTYNFSAFAAYKIKVNASDEMNWVQAEIIVTAKIKANLANLTVLKSESTLIVNKAYEFEISFAATEGASVKIKWDFGASSQEFQITATSATEFSSLNYTYTTTSPYTLTITVSDEFDDSLQQSIAIEVVEEIMSVSLTATPTIVATGNTTVFTAILPTVTGSYGTVYYTYDFKDGNSAVNQTVNTTSHSYSAVNVYTVEVTATNGVSTKTSTVQVTAEEAITGLAVTGTTPVLLYQDTTYSAAITKGSNVKYVFTESTLGITSSASSSNQYNFNFTAVGVYSVQVTATNLVGSDSALLEVHAVTDSTLEIYSITQDPYAPKGESLPVVAKVLHITPSSLTYTWNFGDGTAAVKQTGLLSTSHTYTTVGTYNITLEVDDSAGGKYATKYSEVQVQEKLTGLSLTSSGHGKIETGVPASVTLTAVKNTGTSLTYNWTYDSVTYTSSSETYTLVYNTPATVDVKVTASNQVSDAQANISVIVQHAVEGLTINCLNCIEDGGSKYLQTNSIASLIANVTAGTDISYTFLLDAGSPLVVGAAQTYNYSTASTYVVQVNVSNLVSSVILPFTLNVQDPISDFQITSVINSALVNNSITITTSVSGTDPKYTWKWCDTCTAFNSSSGTSSPYYLTFGYFTVTVTAYNAINSVSLTKGLSIHAPITVIYLTSPHLINESGTLYIGVGETATLTATADNTRNVYYSWQCTRPNSITESYNNQQTVNCSFPIQGQYVITVKAYNTPSSYKQAFTITAVVAISNVGMTGNSSSPLATGSGLKLAASVQAGTVLTYKWILDSQIQSETSNTFELSFQTSGNYIIGVNISNPLGEESKTVEYEIQDVVDGISIIPPSSANFFPFVTNFQGYTFTSNVTEGDAYTVEWELYDTGLQGSATGLTYYKFFTSSSNYTLHMNVKNDVSSKTTSMVFSVQSKLHSLKLVAAVTIATTGDTLNFEADHNIDANYLTYQWTLESVMHTTATKTKSFMFAAPGKYTIHLRVFNQVSEFNATKDVTIQDAIENLNVTGCDAIINVTATTQAVATVTKGTDIDYLWTTTLASGSSLTQVGSTFSYAFQETAVYTLSLNATNLVDAKHLQCKYTVIGIISDVVLNTSSSIYFVNYTMVFFVTGTNLVGVTYEWSISPIGENTTSTTNLLTKDFTAPGTYTVLMRVYHSLNSVTLSETFIIDQLRCNVHVLTAGGNLNRKVTKSQSVVFEVDVDRNGCTEYDLIYKWRIYSAVSCDDFTNSVNLDSLPTSYPKFIVTNGTLDYGQYCVMLSTEYKGTPLLQNVTYTLEVISSSLVSVISGGSERIVPENKDMKVDGSMSFDPDYSSSLQYSWTCTVTGGTGSACSSFTGSNSQSVNLSAGQLVSGEKYDITLTVSASGRTSGSSSQTITVSSADIPIVSVECLTCVARNRYRFNVDQQLKLVGKCENCQSVTSVSYTWSASYDNSGTFVSVNLDSTNTNTDITKSNLVINANVLTAGKTYKFTLNIDKTVNTSVTTSSSNILLQANTGPSMGSCTATSTPIIALQNLVSLSCSGFTDPDGVSTELYYKVMAYSTDSASAGDSAIIYYGTRTSVEVYLAPWPGENRGTVELKVYVIDEDGATLEGHTETISFNDATLANSETKTVYLQSAADGDMIGLIKQNSPGLLLQYCIAMVQELNEESRKADVNDTEQAYRATLRNILTLTAMGLPMEGIQEQQQMAFFMNQLTKYPEEFQNSNCQDLVLGEAQNIKAYVDNLAIQGMDQTDFSPDSLLETVSNTMAAVNIAVYSTATVTLGYFNSSMQQYIASISSLTNVFSSSTLTTEDHRKEVVTNAFKLAEDIIAVNLKLQVVGEKAVELRLDNKMRIYGVRSYTEELTQDYITNSSSVTVQEKMLEGITNEQEVFQIYLVINQNPYTWNLFQGQTVSTRLVSLSITDTTGNGYTISGLSSDKTIKMILADANQELTLGNGSLISALEYDPKKSMKTRDIIIREGSPKIVNLDTSSGFIGAALHVQVTFNILTTDAPAGATPAVGLKVYLGKDIDKPEPCSFTKSMELTEVNMVSGGDHRQYTFYVSDFLMSSKYKLSLFNNDANYPVNVSVGIYFTSCQYYKKVSAIWDNSGTQSMDESIPMAMVCSADHLTAFSGSMLVPPDAISFDDLTFEEILSNPVVFITCGIVLAVYVVAVIICRRMDLTDIERISSVPLCGKDGSYKYEITVVTGRQRGAGTTAHVGIKLYGDYGKSRPRHLSKKGAFQRNCQDSFNIAHDTNLGNIDKILIWHDNHGMDPSWYLVQVIIRDLQTDHKYFFFANCWFSLEMEHGFIQKDIKAADSSEIKRFGRMFNHAISTSLADRHLWVSIIDRPAQSRFTRVQRVTCIVTILYTFMCLNAVWYGVIKQKDTGSTQGVSSFGWEEVVVSLVTNATVFPVALILISIFKKSRSKSNVFEQGNRSSTARTIEIDNACDTSDYNSFRTNDDLLSYLERESTTESTATAAEEAVGPVGLRRTKTLKTSHHLTTKPSTADSTTSTGKDKTNQLKRTNNPGLWKKDSFIESWQNRLPGNTTETRPDTSRSQFGKEKVQQEAKEAADEIMQYLDDVETDIFQKESKRVKTSGTAKSAGSILIKPTIMRRTATRESNPPSSSSSEGKGGLKKRMSTLSVASSKTSSSHSRRHFTPREEPAIPEHKPTSAGNVNKWVSKLKTTVSTMDSKQNTMPEVEHIGPLEPDVMLSRQQSHPNIVSRGMHSFSIDAGSHRPAKKCTLPAWCVYLGYVLCFILSVVSIIIVMLYGYQFGSDVALEWVLALLFSMALSFIVIEPLKVLFIAFWLSAVEKKPNPYEEDDIIDIQPAIDNSVEHIKETKFKPLGGFALLNAKEDGQKIQRMQLMLRQFVAYVFYLWLLMVLCYVNFSTDSYTFSSNAEKLFIKTTLPDSNYSIQNLTSFEDFWNWTQTVLSEGLHGSELNIDEEYSDLLGVARLRQVRSLTETCMAASTASRLGASALTDGTTCVGSDSYNEDEKTYGESWNISQSHNLSWHYYTASETGSKRRYGYVYSYSGGGYIQPLGTSYNETLNILQDLQSKDWITLRTRAVFIDFTLYNPATDLTTFVNIMIEFPLTGAVNTTYDIQTQKLLRFIDGIADPLMVCECILFLVLLYLLIHIALGLKDTGCTTFLKEPWNLFELFTTLLVMVVMGLYVGCVIEATNIFRHFFSNSNSFTNFETVSDIHVVMRYIQAWLLFLLMFKVVKQLRFVKFLYMYEKTLSEAVTKLLGAGLIFAILFLVHAMFAYLLYGAFVGGFESYAATLTTLIGMIRGTFDFWPMFEYEPVFTHLFFYSYYCTVYGLTIGLIVAILNDSYKTVRSQLYYKASMDMQDHEMVDFMLKRFKLWAGFSKPKPGFRRVHFQGEPSISSRCTSSYSTRSMGDDSAISSDGLSSLIEPPANAVARLTSTWEDVLNTMDRVSHLDKVEEDLIRKTQRDIDEWKFQSRMQSFERERQGLLSWSDKPPTGRGKTSSKVPHTTFKGRRSTVTANSSGGASKTPPSNTVNFEKAPPSRGRPLSDQGGRAQPPKPREQSSVYSFFKSLKPSKPAW